MTSNLNPNSDSAVTSENLDNFNRILKCTTDGFVDLNDLLILTERPGVQDVEVNSRIPIILENISNDSLTQLASIDNLPSKYWGQEKIELAEANQIIWEHEIEHPELFGTPANVGILEYGLKRTHLAFSHSSISVVNYNGGNNINNSYTLGIDHGTKVTGLIVGKSYDGGDNEYILQPVAPNTNITLIQEWIRIENNLLIAVDEVVSAIQLATSLGLRVLNCSFGFTQEEYSGNAIYNALYNYPGLIVCGAGNSGRNTDSNPFYPASYDLNNIISVGAININDQLMNADSNSNYGLTSVDVFAPGENIYMPTYIDDDSKNCCDFDSGTSFAAPFVTGLASLLISIEASTPYGSFSTAGLKKIIMESVTETTYLSNYCVSGGYINAKKAIEEAYTNKISYEYYNDTYHWVYGEYCDSKLEEHNWVVSFPNLFSVSIPRIMVCSICGASKII